MIEFRHVSKTYGQQKAVDDLNLHLGEGSFSVLIGTSGSGKSTTLKMINRLVEHDSGQIRFAGEEIRSLPVLELRRRMGYAIQSIGLFPHWTVAQNIATVPQLQKWSRSRIDDRTDELMALLGLEESLRHRYPHQLSGGQQQRVGVARALAADPQVLLMDEPFGALDPVTRGALQQEMTRIHRLLGRTIVLVTHDIDEALRLAEHLVLMDAGKFALLNIIQTIPSVALFGLLIAPLAGLVKHFPLLGKFGVAGTGMTPALIALVLYALLPLVRGVVAGLNQVPRDVLESARAMGMNTFQRFVSVQFPLALPVFLRSLRVVMVQTVGMAVIAALIGAGGFGALVFQGLLSSAVDLVLLGVIPVVVLAVLIDALFDLGLALLKVSNND